MAPFVVRYGLLRTYRLSAAQKIATRTLKPDNSIRVTRDIYCAMIVSGYKRVSRRPVKRATGFAVVLFSTFIFAYAKGYNWLEGKASVSSDLLRTLRTITEDLEVGCCNEGEWESAIVQGFAVWREIKKRGSGTLVLNLDERTIAVKE